MLVIGIDPHKTQHTAVAADPVTERLISETTFSADQAGYQAFSEWLRQVATDRIGIEGARGLGRNLTDWLISQGIHPVDVPPREVRRRRSLRKGGTDKNDRADAFACALAAAAGLGDPVTTSTDAQLAALLAEERDQLNAEATAKRNRLHALMRDLRPGGMDRGLPLARISDLLKGLRAADPISLQRKIMARRLLADLRSLQHRLNGNERAMSDLLEANGTHLRDLDGIATITATEILAAVGDIDRFATEAQLASFTGAAPRQIASATHSRHRLNRGGPRRLRRALHWAALTQSRLPNRPGRAYYLNKRDEGKTHREALRCLKRQIVKAIWRTMRDDSRNQPATP